MSKRQFGPVTSERRGDEGTVTVGGFRWLEHPAWFWIGIGLFGVGGATSTWAPDVSWSVGLNVAAAMVLVIASGSTMAQLVRRGVVTSVRKLEVYLRSGTAGTGYREASTPARHFLRMPHREVPLEQARNVTRTKRYVKPKDRAGYWVHGVYLTLSDEVIDVVSIARKEGEADALAKHLAELLRVKVRYRSDDPSRGGTAVVVGVLLVALMMPVIFLTGIPRPPWLAGMGPPWIGSVLAVALMLLVRFGLFPFVAALQRRASGPKLAQAFRLEAPPAVGVKPHEIGRFVLSLLTLAGAGLFVASQTRSAVATDHAEAAREAERIPSWAWGHDAVPWPAELNGDGVTDYVGAFQAVRPNGATVVAAIDGKTHATLWRSEPLMMNLGHHHCALVGDRVVVVEKGKPARLLDAATGRGVGTFAPDPLWGKLNPSRLCPDPASPKRLVIEGYVGAKTTLALDLDEKTVQPTEPVSWCRFERPPGQAEAISPEPIATAIAVGDYGLSLGPTAQITRDGKPIKRFAFTDVQDGPLCGSSTGPAVWVPVAAGGGVVIDLPTATIAPAARPSWCPEAAVPKGPAFPADAPAGTAFHEHALVTPHGVVAFGADGKIARIYGYDRAGSALVWSHEVGPVKDFAWDASAKVVVIAFRGDDGAQVVALDAATGRPRFSAPLTDAPAGTTFHGVRLADRALFVAHGRRLELLDAETGALIHRHGP